VLWQIEAIHHGLGLVGNDDWQASQFFPTLAKEFPWFHRDKEEAEVPIADRALLLRRRHKGGKRYLLCESIVVQSGPVRHVGRSDQVTGD
jgi:hypothetical protein